MDFRYEDATEIVPMLLRGKGEESAMPKSENAEQSNEAALRFLQQMKLETFIDRKMYQNECLDLAMQFITEAGLSFNFVGSGAFKDFTRKLRPGFFPPTRKKLGKRVVDYSLEKCEKIIESCVKYGGGSGRDCAVIIDMWFKKQVSLEVGCSQYTYMGNMILSYQSNARMSKVLPQLSSMSLDRTNAKPRSRLFRESVMKTMMRMTTNLTSLSWLLQLSYF